MTTNTRAYEVSMIVYADKGATVDTIRSLVDDLTWVGKSGDPLDPRFASLEPQKVRIFRCKKLDR